jgi:hypothetical protein
MMNWKGREESGSGKVVSGIFTPNGSTVTYTANAFIVILLLGKYAPS